MNLKNEIKALEEAMIADRRHLHRHPELAFHEYRTTAFLKQRLQEFGVELEPLDMETGVSALIRGVHDGPTVCIRNDMDALPIQERTGLPFASCVESVCHCCGHDIHAVTALYCAKLLQERREALHGNVRIVIQPAEEGASGAYAMAAAGAMDFTPKTDIVVGTHVHPAVPVGSISVMPGPAQAASDHFTITVKGVGGHGAYPHLCVDPIVVSAYLIAQLQTVVSRETQPTKPAVLTFGTISGGVAANAIPREVTITGTLRSLYPDSRKHNKEAIIRITEGVCSAMRAEGTVIFEDPGIPPVINDPETTQAILVAAEKILGKGHGIITEFPSMGSDDFSVFLEYSRGVQLFVGSANNDPATKIGLHCGDNVFDESALSVGVSVLTQYVLDALGA